MDRDGRKVKRRRTCEHLFAIFSKCKQVAATCYRPLDVVVVVSVVAVSIVFVVIVFCQL